MVFCIHCNGVLCVEHANVLELCYIELLSGDGSPYSILSGGGVVKAGSVARILLECILV